MMRTMTHWFSPPVDKLCTECGKTLSEGEHKKACLTVATGKRPGYGFCRLERDHQEPHEFFWNFDGSVTKTVDGEEVVL